jgi:hypothetical protein
MQARCQNLQIRVETACSQLISTKPDTSVDFDLRARLTEVTELCNVQSWQFCKFFVNYDFEHRLAAKKRIGTFLTR